MDTNQSHDHGDTDGDDLELLAAISAANIRLGLARTSSDLANLMGWIAEDHAGRFGTDTEARLQALNRPATKLVGLMGVALLGALNDGLPPDHADDRPGVATADTVAALARAAADALAAIQHANS